MDSRDGLRKIGAVGKSRFREFKGLAYLEPWPAGDIERFSFKGDIIRLRCYTSNADGYQIPVYVGKLPGACYIFASSNRMKLKEHIRDANRSVQ